MGIYLNSKNAYGMFRNDCAEPYYVDKTDILQELVPTVATEDERGSFDPLQRPGMRYVAITRPRRFGKTMMANMIDSYFNKGIDSHEEFDRFKVSQYPWYRRHLNHHNVIHIMFNRMPNEIASYDEYIGRIKRTLITDLRMAYPNAEIER